MKPAKKECMTKQVCYTYPPARYSSIWIFSCWYFRLKCDQSWLVYGHPVRIASTQPLCHKLMLNRWDLGGSEMQDSWFFLLGTRHLDMLLDAGTPGWRVLNKMKFVSWVPLLHTFHLLYVYEVVLLGYSKSSILNNVLGTYSMLVLYCRLN